MDTGLSNVSGFQDLEAGQGICQKFRTRMTRFNAGMCPYGRDNHITIEEIGYPLPSVSDYEAMQSLGWRRSGMTCYRPICRSCTQCIPLRLDLATWKPDKRLLTLDRKNSDIEVSITKAVYDPRRYQLYNRYLEQRHGDNNRKEPESLYNYHQAYCQGFPEIPANESGNRIRTGSFIIDYKDKKNDCLIANGYVDILPDGISSVYYVFEPKESGKSLGTWSVLKEANIARELGLHYYYLGFWVPDSQKMDYKSRFGTIQISVGGQWMEAANRNEALSIMHEFSGK